MGDLSYERELYANSQLGGDKQKETMHHINGINLYPDYDLFVWFY